MEFKTIIYIVLGILWFLFKNMQRKKKLKEEMQESESTEQSSSNDKVSSQKEQKRKFTEPKPQPVRSEHREPEYERPKSFQELIDELSKVNNPPEREIKIEPEPEFIDKPWEEEVEKKPVKVVVEGGVKKDEFKRFDVYDELEDEEESPYAELLKDENSARRAFVASEIFNRKY